MKNFNKFYKFLSFLSKSEFICIMIILLMNVLVIGTLIQKEIGIKSAKALYFDSFFIYFKHLILPGGKLIFFLIFISLFIKLLIDLKSKLGSLIIHLSFFIFLMSSFFLIDTNEEKFLILKENTQSNTIINNNKIDLKIIFKSKELHEEINLLKNDKLNKNIKISDNFYLKIKNYYINSNVFTNNNLLCKNYYIPLKSLSFVESNFDKAFLFFYIIDKENNILNETFFIENNFDNISFNINKNKCHIMFNKLEEQLPFYIYLDKFTKILYAKSLSVKGYKSDLIIKDSNLEWKYSVEMNNPLKYKKYIFYQASFIENDGYSTILYVSNNYKNVYVYISCFFIIIGFFVLFMEILKRRYKNDI